MRHKRSGLPYLAVVFLAAAFGLQGCGDTQEPPSPRATYELSEAFVPADAATRQNFRRHAEVLRTGERKQALVLVAPAVMRAPMDETEGRRLFECWAAPVFNVGDGIQLNVRLRRGGARILEASRYFDPGRRAEDRGWIPLSIPIDVAKGDELELEVSAGPQGDLVADWLALSGIRLESPNLNPEP